MPPPPAPANEQAHEVPVAERAFPPPEPWRWEVLAAGGAAAALLLYSWFAMREAPLEELRDQLQWGGVEDLKDAFGKLRRWLGLARLGLPSVALLLHRPGILAALLGVFESAPGGAAMRDEAAWALCEIAAQAEGQQALLQLGALAVVRRHAQLDAVPTLFLLSSLAQSPEGARAVADDPALIGLLVRALAESMLRAGEVDRYAQRALLRTFASLAEHAESRPALLVHAAALDTLLSSGLQLPDTAAWQHHARLLVTLRATVPQHFPRLTQLVPSGILPTQSSASASSETAALVGIGAITAAVISIPWAVGQVQLTRVYRPFRPLSLYHRRRVNSLLVRTPALAAALFISLHGILGASATLSSLMISRTFPQLPSPEDQNGRALFAAAVPFALAPVLVFMVAKVSS